MLVLSSKASIGHLMIFLLIVLSIYRLNITCLLFYRCIMISIYRTTVMLKKTIRPLSPIQNQTFMARFNLTQLLAPTF